jgi:hypothetical protein
MGQDARRPNANHHALLVVSVATFMLGVAMVSRGVLLAQPAHPLIPRQHAGRIAVEIAVVVPDERPRPTPSLGADVSRSLMTCMGGQRNTGVAPCPPCLDPADPLCLVPAEPTPPPRGRARERPVAAAKQYVPRGSAARPPASPLYPLHGATLWERVRASSPRDRRTFLLATAIQLHAPATAATPGPQWGFPGS